MVMPEFLRKLRTSQEDDKDETKEPYKVDLRDKPDTPESDSAESDTETATFKKQTNTSKKAKFSAKCITRVVVILLVAAALTFAVLALVYKGSHGAEKSVGCDVNIHTYVHKGKIIHERGSQHAKIQCEDGHKLIGPQVIECLPSGHWNATPTCVPKECKNFPVPANAHVKLKNVASSIMKEFQVSCNEGYLLKGNRTVVCQSDETWSPVPVCKPVDCGDPPQVLNGEIEDLGETTYNNTFLVKCNDGYYLEEGNETVICEANGKWDEIPECAPVSCGLPNKPNHAIIQHIEGKVFQKSISFGCIEGFEMQGDPTITCQSNGNWSPFPVCKPVNCGVPLHPTNGRIKNLKHTIYNSDFVVECNDGYALEGNENVKCESSGKWGAIPVCEPVSCGQPHTPYNAHIISQGGHVFEKSVIFKCQTGYRMKGYSEVTCQSNGQWTEYPKCEYIDPCHSSPCYNGNCVSTGNSYTCTITHVSQPSG